MIMGEGDPWIKGKSHPWELPYDLCHSYVWAYLFRPWDFAHLENPSLQ